MLYILLNNFSRVQTEKCLTSPFTLEIVIKSMWVKVFLVKEVLHFSLSVVSSLLQLLILCNHGDHMGLIFGYNMVNFTATLLRLNNTCFLGIIPPGHNVLIFEMIECLDFSS